MYLKSPLKWIQYFTLLRILRHQFCWLKKQWKITFRHHFAIFCLLNHHVFFPHIFPRWPRRQEACVIKATACPGPVDCSPLTVVAKDYQGAVDPDDPDGYRWLFGDWLHEPWGTAIGKMMKHGDRIGIWPIWIGFGKIFTGFSWVFPMVFPMKPCFFSCKVSHPSNENSQGFFGDWILGISSGIHGEYLISLGFETGCPLNMNRKSRNQNSYQY